MHSFDGSKVNARIDSVNIRLFVLQNWLRRFYRNMNKHADLHDHDEELGHDVAGDDLEGEDARHPGPLQQPLHIGQNSESSDA